MFTNDPRWADLPAGIGYRIPHHAALVASCPAVGFLEVHPENYMAGGPRRAQLLGLRRDHEVSLHGVGLSLGSASRPDARHLERLAELTDATQPFLISEHLSWSGHHGIHLNDLVPLPLTEETLGVVARNVEIVQDRLKRPILVENVSAYLRWRRSTIPEPAFMAELVRTTGCGVLLDINNVYVTAANLGTDPYAWLGSLSPWMVGEIHLAGHSEVEADGATLLIDDHGSPVPSPVLRLYAEAIRRFPNAPTLVEWDSRLPPLEVLVAEAAEVDRLRRETFMETSHARAA